MKRNTIYHGNCLEVLKTLPDNSIDCCVTSPPYFGLRDYGTASWVGGSDSCKHEGEAMRTKANINKNTGTGTDRKNGEAKEFYKKQCEKCGAVRVDAQIGLEETPELFVAKMVQVFDEVKRVLKPSGTLWLNIGDSYAGSGKGKGDTTATNYKQGTNKGSRENGINNHQSNYVGDGIKAKDLIGIPWMLAFALRAAGWYLRQEIIWAKPNPMPESVTDRCTKAHEQIFLLTKAPKYYFDAEAIKTESLEPEDDRGSRGNQKRKPTELINGIRNSGVYPKANKRSVWTVTTQPFSEAHFATFPEKLIEDCILSGSSAEGCCSECGKPHERILNKELVPTYKASFNSIADERDFEADKQDQGSNRMKDGHKPGWAYVSETTGWKPTCECESAKVPAIVLDPFSGAGTTAIVAKKKGRDYIGIELNEKYLQLSEKRLYNEIGMFL